MKDTNDKGMATTGEPRYGGYQQRWRLDDGRYDWCLLLLAPTLAPSGRPRPAL